MSDSQFVIVHTAQSYQEAQILVGFLKSEGLEARVPGAELSDEFGMAQKLVGTADVAVLRRDVDQAKEIVAAWNERGAQN